MLNLMAASTRLSKITWSALAATGRMPLVAGEGFVEDAVSRLVVRVGFKKVVGYLKKVEGSLVLRRPDMTHPSDRPMRVDAAPRVRAIDRG